MKNKLNLQYLSKKIFEAKLTSVLDEELKNTVTEEQVKNKEVNEKHKEIQRFIQFICNILCGYDEDNNIRNDSISFSLLKKKISSNLQNFAKNAELIYVMIVLMKCMKDIFLNMK